MSVVITGTTGPKIYLSISRQADKAFVKEVVRQLSFIEARIVSYDTATVYDRKELLDCNYLFLILPQNFKSIGEKLPIIGKGQYDEIRAFKERYQYIVDPKIYVIYDASSGLWLSKVKTVMLNDITTWTDFGCLHCEDECLEITSFAKSNMSPPIHVYGEYYSQNTKIKSNDQSCDAIVPTEIQLHLALFTKLKSKNGF